MTRPGTEFQTVDLPQPASVPVDTGTWFVAGLTEKGPVDQAVLCRSLQQFVDTFGGRVSYSVLYDALETYFREGGTRAYVTRVVGPAAAPASVNLSDGTADTLAVSAVNPGNWGNGAATGLDVQVVAGGAGGTFVLVIRLNDIEVERSPDLADTAAAITWALSSSYVRATELAGTGDPVVVGPTNLTGGTDDRASITDAQWAAALARCSRDLGPGQVSFPGRTTAAAHGQLLDHAATHNRVAVLDAPDSAVVATVDAAADAIRNHANARYGGLFAPWVVIPGIAADAERTVPPSAFQAGLEARRDATLSPAVPAANEEGMARFAIDLSATFTDAEHETLNAAGVNLIRSRYGRIKTLGYRSVADPVTVPEWWMLNHARLRMAIQAQGDAISERFLFKLIDGQGHLFGQFHGELNGMLGRFYDDGALYGASMDEAFRVDVGEAVNTTETIAAGELHAVLSVRMSKFAELVVIRLVKVSTTQEI